ncbi:MAG TPA: serpin family protein [Acetivibrio sp.]|uniref:serpin family protein n=1 Tax=Acetivibrio sp. TaxID=1872092 RepID=UPI002CD0C227|nr:serpin family protein [Acetivibrio sp.]HOM01961.1 serpin family protein [Acetivibrio sp.]
MQKKIACLFILVLLSSFLFASNVFAENWYTYYELYPDPVVTDTSAVVKFELTKVIIDDSIMLPGYIYEFRYWKVDEPSNVKRVLAGAGSGRHFDGVQTIELTDLEPNTEYEFKFWGQFATWNKEGTPETITFRTLPKKGDLNGDGKITSTDLYMLKRYLLHMIDTFGVDDEFCADLNGDGKINSSDYSLLKRYILHVIDKFPVENDEPNEGISDGFIEGNSKFAFDIFKQISKNEQGENVFISPFGISTALSMVYQGAEFDTKEEMAKVLGYEGLDIKEVNKSYKYLLKYFAQLDEKVKLKNSNSIWNNSLKGDAIKEDFISANRDVFNALVEIRDFSDESVVDEINNWISEATEGKIDNMLSKISPDDLSYIISALYFNGVWKEEFDIEKTYSSSFEAEDGSVDDVMMMRKDNCKIEFGAGDGYRAVRLPYGNGEMAMYCILPDQDISINDFIQNLDVSMWNQIKSSITERNNGVLCLPRFKIEYAKNGNGSIMESLKALGMEKVFENGAADLSGMTENGAYIADVLHKAVVEVNEKGTEAASVVIVPIAPGIGLKPEFVANRPFVFIIADEKYDTILFMGKVSNGEFAN